MQKGPDAGRPSQEVVKLPGGIKARASLAEAVLYFCWIQITIQSYNFTANCQVLLWDYFINIYVEVFLSAYSRDSWIILVLHSRNIIFIYLFVYLFIYLNTYLFTWIILSKVDVLFIVDIMYICI